MSEIISFTVNLEKSKRIVIRYDDNKEKNINIDYLRGIANPIISKKDVDSLSKDIFNSRIKTIESFDAPEGQKAVMIQSAGTPESKKMFKQNAESRIVESMKTKIAKDKLSDLLNRLSSFVKEIEKEV